MMRQRSVSPGDPGFTIKDNGSWPKKKRDLSNERLLQFNPDQLDFSINGKLVTPGKVNNERALNFFDRQQKWVMKNEQAIKKRKDIEEAKIKQEEENVKLQLQLSKEKKWRRVNKIYNQATTAGRKINTEELTKHSFIERQQLHEKKHH